MLRAISRMESRKLSYFSYVLSIVLDKPMRSSTTEALDKLGWKSLERFA